MQLAGAQRFGVGRRAVLAAAVAIYGACGLAHAQPADVPGAADHPLISRFPGSVIKWYAVENYRPYRVPTGPVAGYRRIDQWLDTAGRVTRVYYEYDGARTHAELYENYKAALEAASFEIVASGFHADNNVRGEVGGATWLGVVFGVNAYPTDSGVRLLQGSSSAGGTAYVAGKKARAEGDVYVGAAIKQFDADTVVALVDVVEAQAVESGLVIVDAEAIGRDIAELGRVVLDGLQFAHDEAALLPESRPALEQIAAFLRMEPESTFYVVGHTDSTGTFAYNAQLSADRARAVVEALVREFGIGANRLEPHGVGPLSPVFSNGGDAGRARNRRVELVQR